MAQYTPGPWVNNCFSVCQAGDSRLEVAHTGLVGPNKQPQQAEADAKLIAAAPEMHELLNWLRDHLFNGSYISMAHIDRIDAVLAKAAGR